MEQIKLARPATTLLRPIAYWISTGLIVMETALGAEWDFARITFVKDVFAHLGYPLYLLTILGIWKVPATKPLLYFGTAGHGPAPESRDFRDEMLAGDAAVTRAQFFHVALSNHRL